MNPLHSPTATTAREAITFGSNHPYGHSTYGTVQENQSFTTEDVKKWYEKYFFPENVILFIVGNFETQNAKSLIEKEFSVLNRTGHMMSRMSPPARIRSGNFTILTSSKTNFISLLWQIPGWMAADAGKLQVLANLLDERLQRDSFASIVKAGATDLFNLHEWAGQFGVFASFSSLPDSTKIQKHLTDVINDIIEKGVSENELGAAKQKILNNVKDMINKLGFIGSTTELLGEGFLYSNNPGYYILRLKNQFQLTTKEIQAIATIWLKKEGARLLLISTN